VRAKAHSGERGKRGASERAARACGGGATVCFIAKESAMSPPSPNGAACRSSRTEEYAKCHAFHRSAPPARRTGSRR